MRQSITDFCIGVFVLLFLLLLAFLGSGDFWIGFVLGRWSK